jgi:hypothetical protein
MIHLSIEASNAGDLLVQLRALTAVMLPPLEASPNPVTIQVTPVEQPQKRTRKAKDAPAEQTAAASAPTVETQAGIATPGVDLFASDVSNNRIVEQKAPEQKDLIAAFRALNDKKGSDPIVKLLGEYGAKTVALIPKDKWSEAISKANAAAQ